MFWAYCGAAVIVQGISKSGFAGGAGILSLPLMLLVMPADRMVAALLPILILCDFNALYHHWHNRDWGVVLAIYLPACVGIALGVGAWWWMGRMGVEAWNPLLKQLVGVLAIVFAAYLAMKEFALAWVARHRFGPVAAWVLGTGAGFTSTLAHAAGPLVSLYVFSQGLGKTLFVGTVAWTFTLINLTKLPFYVAIGMIDRDVLLFDALLVPLIPLGSWLGHWMHHRVAESAFNRIILALTLLAGIQAIADTNFILAALRWLQG
jgi:uncharacterized membrane protein YfcA